MSKAIVGMNFADFEKFCKKDEDHGYLQLRPARLIPLPRTKEEAALTSVFLSALRLVEEFRENFCSEIHMSPRGKVYIFTEIVFPKYADQRMDGLLLAVKGGKISDAVLFEMKQGSNTLDKAQVEGYLKIAQEYGIDKFVTVSNEYVLDPTQSPVGISNSKVHLYHFSWTSILTMARLLLFKEKEHDDSRIGDADQVEIMREIVSYWESEESGVCGFTCMKAGWKNTIDNVASGVAFKDDEIKDAISSWHQECKDMALLLSRKLGMPVLLKEAKSKKTFSDLIDDTVSDFKKTKDLSSQLCVKNAVSPIAIVAHAGQKSIEMSVQLEAPEEKKAPGKLGWLKRELEKCKDKATEIKDSASFDDVVHKSMFFENLIINAKIKHSRNSDNRFHFRDFEDKKEEFKDVEITGFEILYNLDFGRDFCAPRKFVERIEQMLLHFFIGIVQNLKNPTASSPKIATNLPPQELGVDDIG